MVNSDGAAAAVNLTWCPVCEQPRLGAHGVGHGDLITDPDPAAVGFPDPAETLGPLYLPSTWQLRAETLEGLMRSLASAKAGAAKIYAAAYLGADVRTAQERAQVATAAAVDAELCVARIAARIAGYRLMLEVEQVEGKGASDA